MNHSIVGDAWAKFRELAIPPDASAGQLRDMERAFFAGAMVLYSALMMIGDDSVSGETGEKILEAIGDELRAFTLTVAAAAVQKES